MMSRISSRWFCMNIIIALSAILMPSLLVLSCASDPTDQHDSSDISSDFKSLPQVVSDDSIEPAVTWIDELLLRSDLSIEVKSSLSYLYGQSNGAMTVNWDANAKSPRGVIGAWNDAVGNSVQDALTIFSERYASYVKTLYSIDPNVDLFDENIKYGVNDDREYEWASVKYLRKYKGYQIPYDHFSLILLKQFNSKEYSVHAVIANITAIDDAYNPILSCTVADARNSVSSYDTNYRLARSIPESPYLYKNALNSRMNWGDTFLAWPVVLESNDGESEFIAYFNAETCVLSEPELMIRVNAVGGYVDTSNVWSFDNRSGISMDLRYAGLYNTVSGAYLDDLNTSGYFYNSSASSCLAYTRLKSRESAVEVPVREPASDSNDDDSDDAIIYFIPSIAVTSSTNYTYSSLSGWDVMRNNVFQQLNYILETIDSYGELDLADMVLYYRTYELDWGWDTSPGSSSVPSTINIYCNTNSCKETQLEPRTLFHELGHALLSDIDFSVNDIQWVDSDYIPSGYGCQNLPSRGYHEGVGNAFETIVNRLNYNGHENSYIDASREINLAYYNGASDQLDDCNDDDSDCPHQCGHIWGQMWNRLNSDVGWEDTLSLMFVENLGNGSSTVSGVVTGGNSILDRTYDVMDNDYYSSAGTSYYEISKYFSEHNTELTTYYDELSDARFHGPLVNPIGSSSLKTYDKTPDEAWDVNDLKIQHRTSAAKYDVDYVSFYALKGETYCVRAHETVSLDPEMRHYSGDSTSYTYNDTCSAADIATCGFSSDSDDPCFLIAAVDNGWHDLRIYDAVNPAYDYSYSVQVKTLNDDFADDIGGAFPIARDYQSTLASSVTYIEGTLNTSDDVDWFRMYVEAGYAYITTYDVAAACDTRISLYSPAGVLLQTSDSYGSGVGETLNRSSLAVNSWYYIRIDKGSSGGIGSYKIQVRDKNSSTLVYDYDLTDNFDPFDGVNDNLSVITTSIYSSSDVDIYRFHVDEGQHVMVDTFSVSPSIGTYLRVAIDEDGTSYNNTSGISGTGRWTYNVNDGGGFDEGGSHIHIVAPTHATTTGYMYVYVYGHTAGAYSIAFRRVDAARNLAELPDVNE